MDARVVLEFLELLIDKAVGHIVPAKFVIFALVGTLGVVVPRVPGTPYRQGFRFARTNSASITRTRQFCFPLWPIPRAMCPGSNLQIGEALEGGVRLFGCRTETATLSRCLPLSRHFPPSRPNSQKWPASSII